MGNDAALLAERLSPLFVLLAPLGYGLGYTQGKPARQNQHRYQNGRRPKKRRERKARRQRQRSKSPERLI